VAPCFVSPVPLCYKMLFPLPQSGKWHVRGACGLSLCTLWGLGAGQGGAAGAREGHASPQGEVRQRTRAAAGCERRGGGKGNGDGVVCTDIEDSDMELGSGSVTGRGKGKEDRHVTRGAPSFSMVRRWLGQGQGAGEGQGGSAPTWMWIPLPWQSHGLRPQPLAAGTRPGAPCTQVEAEMS